MTPKEELRPKPCSFCGSEEIKTELMGDQCGKPEHDYWLIWCFSKNNCDVGSIQADTKEEAVQKWNNLYCWQVIDKLQAQLKDSSESYEGNMKTYRVALDVTNGIIEKQQAKIVELEKEIEIKNATNKLLAEHFGRNSGEAGK